jgi:hypothetical protein
MDLSGPGIDVKLKEKKKKRRTCIQDFFFFFPHHKASSILKFLVQVPPKRKKKSVIQVQITLYSITSTLGLIVNTLLTEEPGNTHSNPFSQSI